MGNVLYPQRIMIDRLIAASPYRVTVGVTGQKASHANPMAEQVLQIGEFGPLRSLMSFSHLSNALEYKFEGGASLCIMRRHDGEYVYHLETQEISYTDTIHASVVRNFSKISLKSSELDEIYTFFATDSSENC
jgi:hypothetical protein